MNEELKNILSSSTFTVMEGTYIYVKTLEIPSGNHFMVTKDDNEVTIVTRVRNLEGIKYIERNKDDYALIALNVSIPFYCVGFLAAVTKDIADKGMNILIVSTYSKDYIMVKYDRLLDAKIVLKNLGFTEQPLK